MEIKNQCLEKTNIGMRISIIIPVYNVADYIVECLDSIENQTYQGDIECILIDDASTDNSREVIKKYIECNHRAVCYRLICQQENMRQGMARNRGLKEATGDYVLFVDSDDTISSDCLEIMVNLLLLYPNADFVLCGMCDMHGNEVFSPNNYAEYVANKKLLMKDFLFPETGIPEGPCNKLIRRNLLVNNDIIFPQNIIYEDVQFSFLLGLYVNSGCFSKRNTYYYRTNRYGSTITTTSKREEYGFFSRIVVLDNCVKRLTHSFYFLQVRALLLRYFLYIKMNSDNVVESNAILLKNFRSHLIAATTGYVKLFVFICLNLPIKVCKKRIVYSLITKLLKLSLC